MTLEGYRQQPQQLLVLPRHLSCTFTIVRKASKVESLHVLLRADYFLARDVTNEEAYDKVASINCFRNMLCKKKPENHKMDKLKPRHQTLQ